ncbi:MAG TPA: HEAT repeat domain-containing protein, partial [Thermoanaerobaculaceae bacterium]|nr:HEAT repeat domain-containing protein [Thermoanaerobaculaceae bacterium]
DAGVRADCARTVSELADPRGAAILTRLAADASPTVRAAAAEGAGRLASFLVAYGRERGELGRVVEGLLRDPEPAVRAAAAWAVGMALPTEGDLWLLHRLSGEPDPSVRAAMLRELWRFPGKLWPKRVTSYLTARDAGVRFAAAWSLSRASRRDAAAGLARAARDPEAAIRVAALDGARRLARPELFATAVDALGDPDRAVRTAALGALESIAGAGGTPALPAPARVAVERMILQRDPRGLGPEIAVLASWGLPAAAAQRPDFTDAQERVAAIRAAGALRCCETQLRSALAADAPWVSGEALAALVHAGAAGAAEEARRWLASDDQARRIAAVRMIPSLPDAGRHLAAALADASPEVRLAAAETAAEVEGPAVAAALAHAFADADPIVRAAAVEASSRHKASPPVAEILALLGKEGGAATPDAAVALVEALGAAEHPTAEAQRALERCAAGADPVVARAAWTVLARHGIARELPRVATGRGPQFYRQVLEWARSDRYLLVVTVRGTMQVRLDTARAPLTCYGLAALADKKFFDGLTFHRVVANFVVQGGDPRGDGWGGPGYVERDELDLEPYAAGAVGIALSGPDTGGSQFFVAMQEEPHLVGRYPRVGTVVNGLDVAARLRVGDRILRVRTVEGAAPPYLPVWYGPLDPARVDAQIPGWHDERAKYRPQAAWLERLRSARLRYGLTVAMGTWCSDSIEQVPRLEAVLAALGASSPFETPRLIGIDRTKVPDPALYKFAPVELSPTIVVTAGGSEVGRIVETPKSGSIEEDLARILAPIEGWDLPEPTPAPEQP